MISSKSRMHVKGRRFGGDVANWFSIFLQTPDLDLVYFDEEFDPQHVKDIQPEVPNEAQDTDVSVYHDMSPFHLASLESLNDLNQRLEHPVKISNFRPNIIVSGLNIPYGEDYWREIQIGDQVKLRWFRSCLRRLLPTINQETGIRDSTSEPWKTLQTYRRKPNIYGDKPLFGIYLAPSNHGLISVGDRIKILHEDENF